MRYIKLTEELKNQAMQDFLEKLNTERFSDSSISFSFDLKSKDTLEDKVILNITPTAWLKMWSLVQSESGEIGWHGLVDRLNTKMFQLQDIVLYPQYVSGTTVTTDDVGYGNWLHKEISDEDINRLRLHGHSHVNMSTSPSGVDTTWYNQILQGLMNDDYYIFMILNKRDDYFIEIYDLATNTIYEKKDIVINVVLPDNNYLQSWLNIEKKKALQTKNYTNRLGFDYSDMKPIKTYDDIKPFDADDEESSFEDLLANLTSADLKDPELTKGVVAELDKRAPYSAYFSVGYMHWNLLLAAEKIEVAQDYYESKASKPKKKGRGRPPKKHRYSWEDLYD